MPASVARVPVLPTVDRAQIEDLLRRDEFFWLELEAPGEEELATLGEVFGFHPLTLEDNRKFGQRAKLEDYGDYVFIVFYGARREGERVRLSEVHLFISGSYVVTIHREPLPGLDELRDKLARDPRQGEQFVIYKIFDTLTDSFFPVLSEMDDKIDSIEDDIVLQPTDEQLQAIFGLKRDLVALRRAVTPQRDLFARAIDDVATLPGLEPANRDYFRDIYDHLIRISDQIDSYRDLLTSAMDVYLSTVSNRLNQVMKQLTIVATIFLPLTFVTGFFGQNFGWMVNQIDTLGAFLAFGAAGLALTLALVLAWYRRSGYL